MMNIDISNLSTFLAEIAPAQEIQSSYSFSLVVVFLVGLLAAAGIGSFVWNKSKKPLTFDSKNQQEELKS